MRVQTRWAWGALALMLAGCGDETATTDEPPADEPPPVACEDPLAFELPDGSVLTGFSVHFPAPFHPTEMREVAYRRLNELRGSRISG